MNTTFQPSHYGSVCLQKNFQRIMLHYVSKIVSKWLHCSLLISHNNFANVFYTNIVEIIILVNIELFVTNAKLL
jgi:hypothetical protein